MNICAVHGQAHQGSTYHVARQLTDALGGDVREFFLPTDFNGLCGGCTACFARAEKLCRHADALAPITAALDAADVIVLSSPVYVYHVTGAMKNFLDRYGWRWMIHRPEPAMFTKQAVCISTAAGAGTKSTNQDMADSLFFWGVAKIYRLGYNVHAARWQDVEAKLKDRIGRDTARLAQRIRKNAGRVQPGIKTKAFFELTRRLHRRGWNAVDCDYWHEMGWDGAVRPW